MVPEQLDIIKINAGNDFHDNDIEPSLRPMYEGLDDLCVSEAELSQAEQIIQDPFDNDREPPEFLFNMIVEMGRSIGFDVSTPQKKRALMRSVLFGELAPINHSDRHTNTVTPAFRTSPISSKAERQSKKRQRQARKRNRR